MTCVAYSKTPAEARVIVCVCLCCSLEFAPVNTCRLFFQEADVFVSFDTLTYYFSGCCPVFSALGKKSNVGMGHTRWNNGSERKRSEREPEP